MPNRNPQPRLTCPYCRRPVRAKPVRIDNGDGTETSTLRFVKHVIGNRLAVRRKVKMTTVCDGPGKVVA